MWHKTGDWLQHFADGVLWELGAALISNDADALLARLKVPARQTAGVDRTLVLDSQGGTQHVRLYRCCDGSSIEYYEWAINCSFDGTNWACDATAVDAWLHRYGGAGADAAIQYKRKAATASTWTDSGWTAIEYEVFLDGTSNQLSLRNGAVNFPNATAISASTAVVNKLYPQNTPKLWAVISIDGSGNITIHKGFNITSAALTGNDLDITIAADFDATNDYAVVATNNTGDNRVWSATPQSATLIRCRCYTADTGTAVTLSSGGSAKVSIIAFGIQTP